MPPYSFPPALAKATEMSLVPVELPPVLGTTKFSRHVRPPSADT